MPGSSIIGLTNTPTKYKLILSNGETSYVRCGADLILTGLKMDLSAEAHCPICNKEVRFHISNARIKELTVPDALLYVLERPDSIRGFSVVCEATNLFDKKECLETWVSDYHGLPGKTYTLNHYLHHSLSRRRFS